MIARRLTPDELAGKDQPAPSADKTPTGKILVTERERRTVLSRILASPLTAAWLLAIAISVLVAVLALAPKYRFAPKPIPTSPVGEDDADVPSTAEVQPTLPESAVSDELDPGSQLPFGEETLKVIEEMTDGAPGMPEEMPVVEESKEDANPQPQETPAEPAVPPPPPKIDIQSKLSQKLISYKQIKKVSRRDLIEAFQEHLGAPIHYEVDDLGVTNLDQPVAFELENTTLEEVIRTVAHAAGWEVHVEEAGLRLSRK